MLSPTSRLLWCTLGLAVPAVTLSGIYPPSAALAMLFLIALVAAAAFDAYRLNRMLAQVRLTSEPEFSAYKQRPATVSVKLEMPVRLQKVEVSLTLPASFEVEKPVGEARESSEVRIAFTPQRRGEFLNEEAFLCAASVWGIWRLRVKRQISLNVRVFPDLSRDPASRKLFAVFQPGQRVQRIVGRGREVERLRDYAPGDSFDEVYWKATARRGAPITKVFQVERTQDIYAIIDGSRLGNRNEALERFVSASLLLAIAAERNSDNFGLLTFDQRVQHFVRACHGTGHFHRCREAIFDLQPSIASPDFSELFTFINLRIRKRALLFFLTDLSDPLLAETFLLDASFIARRHVAMVNQIADSGDRPLFSGPLPESDMDVQSRLAGHLQWAKLRELERSLSHIGIHMQLLKPEQTSTQLINQYISVKQRQLL